MRTVSLFLTLAALVVISACSRPAGEQAAAVQEEATEQVEQTTEEAKSATDRDSRDPQSIETYLNRLGESVDLTDAQRASIASLLGESNYEGLSRAEQRAMRKDLRDKISSGILSKDQATAWENARNERKEGRNQDGGK